MTAGLSARLNRISTNDRYLIVPMDHGLTMGAVDGLVDIESTIDGVTRGGADAVLTQKGIAPRVHPNKNDAGYIVHVNGSTTIGPDESDKRVTATAEDAVRAGADAVSFHINVGSDHEPDQIEELAELTADASRLGLPVLAMAYARGPGVDETDPESLGHAVRLAEELGADVVKVKYPGSAEGMGEAVKMAGPTKVVMSGGTMRDDKAFLRNVADAIDAGATGLAVGRNVFQRDDPERILDALEAVVFQEVDPAEALAIAESDD
jgi:fructose-bisphosphate aldolase/2-amino-3,7-dideoxy-D-threo-hept-6-ulosonate synthase